MKISAKQFAVLLDQVTFEKEQDELNKNIQHFVSLVAKRHFLKNIPSIIHEYEKMVREREEVVQATIFSSHKIAFSEKQELESLLLQKTKKKRIELIEKIEPKLIGGARIEFDGWIFDGSIQGMLKKLHERILKI